MATVDVWGDPKTQGALLLTGFLSAGSASPIAARFVIQQLNLPLVGQVIIPNMSHLVAVENGRATSVVRIYGGEVECSLDKGCPSLLVITTEVPIPAQLHGEVAQAITEWARNAGIGRTIVLEAVVRADDDDTPDVWSATIDEKLGKELASLDIPPAPRAVMGGMVANMFSAARDQQLAAGAIMVEALRDQPDGRAAASLVAALDRLLPQIKVDHEPLLKEATAMEGEIRSAVETAESYGPGDHTFI